MEITKSAWQISNSLRPYGATHQHRYMQAIVKVDQSWITNRNFFSTKGGILQSHE